MNEVVPLVIVGAGPHALCLVTKLLEDEVELAEVKQLTAMLDN